MDNLKTNTVYTKEFTVAQVGDMEQGFMFYGPFDDAKAAASWLETNVKGGVLCNILNVKDVRPLNEDPD